MDKYVVLMHNYGITQNQELRIEEAKAKNKRQKKKKQDKKKKKKKTNELTN
jgi:hypothetical protein